MADSESNSQPQKAPHRYDRGFSILVVDDEEGMRGGMKRILERRGYHVELAANGSRAMNLVDSTPYDIALIDLRMPDLDGFTVTDHIARTRGGRTVVVIVSGFATVEAAVDTTREGAFVFNVRGKAVPFNPRAELYLGDRSRSGYRFADLPFGDETKEAVKAVLSGDRAERSVEHELDGRRVRIRVAPYDVDNDVDGAILLLTDVTAEWRAQHNRDRFVSMVAHELNAPVAAIVSYLKMILDGLLADDPAKSNELLERSDDERWIVVSFQDDGIGMSENEMANLFQDFYRITNEKTAGVPGTGLGLATAKRVASDYNGTIEVVSAPSRGSTFTVKIPT